MSAFSFDVSHVKEAPRSYLAQAEGVMPGDLVQSILYGTGPIQRRVRGSTLPEAPKVPIRTKSIVPVTRGHHIRSAREFDADRERQDQDQDPITRIRNSLRPQTHENDIEIPDFDRRILEQYIFPGADEIVPYYTTCVCKVPNTLDLRLETHTSRIHKRLIQKQNILRLALLGTEHRLWPPPPVEDLPILAGHEDHRPCACSYIGPTAMKAFLAFAVPDNVRHQTTAAVLPASAFDPQTIIRRFVTTEATHRKNRARLDSLATRVHAMTTGRAPHTMRFDPIDTRQDSRARRAEGRAGMTNISQPTSIPDSIRNEAKRIQERFSTII